MSRIISTGPQPFELPGVKYRDAVNVASRSAGFGDFDSQLQQTLIGFDRFQHGNFLPPSVQHVGYTFFSRPRLCLTSSSLRQDRIFAPLDTTDPNRLTFMMRCLLDSKFSTDVRNISKVNQCPYFNVKNPFLSILGNNLLSMNGWPDPVLNFTTTPGGFFSEDHTQAVGYDRLSKTYNFSMVFKEIHQGIISDMFFYWHNYIGNVAVGTMLPYEDDSTERLLNYTVGIYRFILDPTRRHVVAYAKGTGSIPQAPSYGTRFNFNEGESILTNNTKLSMQFTINHVGYMDYAILMEFNSLVKRYCPEIEECPDLEDDPNNNFIGIPYINTSLDNGTQIVWKDIDFGHLMPIVQVMLACTTESQALEELVRYIKRGLVSYADRKRTWNIYQWKKNVLKGELGSTQLPASIKGEIYDQLSAV